jgi:hypothetical protein
MYGTKYHEGLSAETTSLGAKIDVEVMVLSVRRVRRGDGE